MNEMFSQAFAHCNNIGSVHAPSSTAQMQMLPTMHCGHKRYTGKERREIAYPACRPRVPVHNMIYFLESDE